MRRIYLIACLALTACVTSSPSASQWTRIEGCWNERAEHWPAFMEWRRDPARLGGYLGIWRREAAQMEIEERRFRLTPVGDRMELCLLSPGSADRCAPAVFGRAGWRRDGVAVLAVEDDYHEFGFAGASLPMFGGHRRGCD